MLLRIVDRFGCLALKNTWKPELKEALDALVTDEDKTVARGKRIEKHLKLSQSEIHSYAFFSVQF